MKKLTAIILSLIFVLSLTGCAVKDSEDTTEVNFELKATITPDKNLIATEKITAAENFAGGT